MFKNKEDVKFWLTTYETNPYLDWYFKEYNYQEEKNKL